MPFPSTLLLIACFFCLPGLFGRIHRKSSPSQSTWQSCLFLPRYDKTQHLQARLNVSLPHTWVVTWNWPVPESPAESLIESKFDCQTSLTSGPWCVLTHCKSAREDYNDISMSLLLITHSLISIISHLITHSLLLTRPLIYSLTHSLTHWSYLLTYSPILILLSLILTYLLTFWL